MLPRPCREGLELLNPSSRRIPSSGSGRGFSTIFSRWLDLPCYVLFNSQILLSGDGIKLRWLCTSGWKSPKSDDLWKLWRLQGSTNTPRHESLKGWGNRMRGSLKGHEGQAQALEENPRDNVGKTRILSDQLTFLRSLVRMRLASVMLRSFSRRPGISL